MLVEVKVYLDNGNVVKRHRPIKKLTQDNLSITAGNLGYELAEDAYAALDDDEDD